MKKQMTMTTGRKMKNDLNSMREYYYGFGQGRYSEVLDELRIHGLVNSYRTSSIPLAECWQPDNLRTIEDKLRPYLDKIELETAFKCFEFPTDPIMDGKCIGRPSMTDLMIMDGNYQIAIEAKYTEYSRMPNETVTEWLKKPGIARFVRRSIARCWLDYIRVAGCTNLDVGGLLSRRARGTRAPTDVIGEIGEVCYQFLHRTASACYKVDSKNGQKAVLIYQLFYDADDRQSRADCEAYKAELRKWAEVLRLKNMKFLIMSVPITNAAEVKELYDGCKEELFEEMKMNRIYQFEMKEIKVEDVPLNGN